MKIGSICTRRIVTIDRESSLADAAGLMREHHVGALVVTAEGAGGHQVLGVVTDRDLVIDVLARGLDAEEVRVGSLANKTVTSVFENEEIDSAIAAMQESGVRRLLVSDGQRRLVGISSFDDLLVACAAQMGALAQVIHSGVQREMAHTSAMPDVPPLLLLGVLPQTEREDAVA